MFVKPLHIDYLYLPAHNLTMTRAVDAGLRQRSLHLVSKVISNFIRLLELDTISEA